EKEATEQTSEEDLDEERFEPRSDDEDTTFEESEDELEVIKSLEKVLTSRDNDTDENDEKSTNKDPTMERSNQDHRNPDNLDAVHVDQSESEQAMIKSSLEDQTTAGENREISVGTNQNVEEEKVDEAESQPCAPSSLASKDSVQSPICSVE
ncbi:unnamed protein product, partial [Staurois parvus]